MNSTKCPVVHWPISISRDYLGEIFGYYHPESNEYNIISVQKEADYILLGKIINSEKKQKNKKAFQILGVRDGEELSFFKGDRKCKIKIYDLTTNIFSRNIGILETNKMLGKSVIISGCGSVGSFVAVELARSGVGNFLLIDNDTLDYHNICRHQCGISDVGDFKVNAVKSRIYEINSSANIFTESKVIERVHKKKLDEFCTKDTIIIGCADNREGDLYADKISKVYEIPFVSIGLWEKAFAGEVFYSIPGKNVGYESIFDGNFSPRVSSNRRMYTFEEDLVGINFEPGISIDIHFVTLVALKLIIDIININNCDYKPRLLDELTQFTLVCNTNDPEIGGEQAEIFAYPLQVTRSIQVS